MQTIYHYVFYLGILMIANGLYAQTQVGDTLQHTVWTGGSITVPVLEEWQFLGLTYSLGGYTMKAAWSGPDTLKAPYTWVAPSWSVESQLLGDGKTEGMYQLKVIRIK